MLRHYLRLYNVNVLTQPVFPSGQTLKVDKSILLKKHTQKNNFLDYTLSNPKDDNQELFFVCFKSQRKAYSYMKNSYVLFTWKKRHWSCPHLSSMTVILPLLFKGNSTMYPPPRWTEQAIAFLLQCTAYWIKKKEEKTSLIQTLGKFAWESCNWLTQFSSKVPTCPQQHLLQGFLYRLDSRSLGLAVPSDTVEATKNLCVRVEGWTWYVLLFLNYHSLRGSKYTFMNGVFVHCKASQCTFLIAGNKEALVPAVITVADHLGHWVPLWMTVGASWLEKS